jgi:hypothetical protein
MSNTKKETFTQWLIAALIIYVIPFCITAIIVVRESWPYKPLHNFINGQRSGKYGDSAKDIISTGVFLITVGIFFGIKYLFTKKKKVSNRDDIF